VKKLTIKDKKYKIVGEMVLARDGMYYSLAIPCNLASEGFVPAKCIWSNSKACKVSVIDLSTGVPQITLMHRKWSHIGNIQTYLLADPYKSISTNAQYETLQKYSSHPSFSY
jgi:hypothetical protein